MCLTASEIDYIYLITLVSVQNCDMHANERNKVHLYLSSLPQYSVMSHTKYPVTYSSDIKHVVVARIPCSPSPYNNNRVILHDMGIVLL